MSLQGGRGDQGGPGIAGSGSGHSAPQLSSSAAVAGAGCGGEGRNSAIDGSGVPSEIALAAVPFLLFADPRVPHRSGALPTLSQSTPHGPSIVDEVLWHVAVVNDLFLRGQPWLNTPAHHALALALERLKLGDDDWRASRDEIRALGTRLLDGIPDPAANPRLAVAAALGEVFGRCSAWWSDANVVSGIATHLGDLLKLGVAPETFRTNVRIWTQVIHDEAARLARTIGGRVEDHVETAIVRAGELSRAAAAGGSRGSGCSGTGCASLPTRVAARVRTGGGGNGTGRGSSAASRRSEVAGVGHVATSACALSAAKPPLPLATDASSPSRHGASPHAHSRSHAHPPQPRHSHGSATTGSPSHS